RGITAPVYAGNDANVAALAEAKAGAGKGVKSAIMLTLGTGVGGGIIVNGRIHTGAHHIAGEVGHMVVKLNGRQCNCGQQGCYERYSSATALIDAGQKAIIEFPQGAIGHAVGCKTENVTAKVVIDAARNGDYQAGQIWRRYLHWLCTGMVTLINIFDPEAFILGGGVSSAGAFLIDNVRRMMPTMVSYPMAGQPRYELASLGNDAGVIGAALLN
ncbi:MAG: ROK family protein, partial [Clostridia bacterium]|nr:ROK family protein [Clostridia bacterium]